MNNYDSVISSFYLAYYGRPADPQGMAFWSDHLARANGDLTDITRAFAESNEALVRFETKTTIERIEDVYLQLFNRQPDAAGLAYWAEAVDSGRTSLADASMSILKGALGSDITISSKREAAASEFTRIVAELDVKFNGFAAVQASHAMLMAIGENTSQAKMLQIVQSLAPMVDALDANPSVLDAIVPGGGVDALFLTARGRAEPENLFLAMSDLTQAAAGNPATLDALLRGGGMGKVLEVMPSKASLADVVGALGKGGLDAAIEVVYPTPKPAPAPAPIAMNIEFHAGTLKLVGKATDSVVVDLDKKIVTFKGQDQNIAGTIAKVIADGYAGKVALSGTVEQLQFVGPQSPGIDLQIVDSKSAIFVGTGGLRLLAPGMENLVNLAQSIKLKEPVSAIEYEILKNVPDFDIGKLQSSIDLTPPVAGKLAFDGLEFADADGKVAFTSKDTVSFKPSGAEEGATIRFQKFEKMISSWVDVPTLSVKGLDEGEHTFRSVVEDAAGNVSYAEAIVNVDLTPPRITKLQFAANDGTIAIDESIELTVTFDGPVNVSEDARIKFSNDGSAAYQRGNGTSELVFSYTPQAGHGAPVLKLDPFSPVSGTIVDRAGNALSLDGLVDVELGAAPQVDVSAPAQSITFTTISQLHGASASVEGSTLPLATNLEAATISATLSGELVNGEHVEYSLNGGASWSEVGVVVEGRSVYINGVATTGNPVMTVRVADAAGNIGKEASHAIVLDTVAPDAGTLIFATVTDSLGEEITDNITKEKVVTVEFKHEGAWYGAGERLQYSTDGTDWREDGMSVNTDANLVRITGLDLSDGKLVADRSGDRSTTVMVRAIDAAGNTSPVGSAELVLDVPLPAPGLRLSSDTGMSTVDNISSKGFVVISGLNKAQGSNWEWAVDGGSWQKGWGSDQSGVATHTIGGEGKHTLLVRQFDKNGGYSAEGKLEFTLDTKAAVLSFKSVSGATVAKPNVVNSDHADVIFRYTGDVGADDRIAYRIDGGDWIRDGKFKLDPDNGTITLENIDLSKSDPLIELQVTDVAGNASNVASVTVDGAYVVPGSEPDPEITLKATPDGLLVTSNVDGTVYVQGAAGTAVQELKGAGGTTQVQANVPFLVGPQEQMIDPVTYKHLFANGTIVFKTASGKEVLDPAGTWYQFGTDEFDHMVDQAQDSITAWAFGGDSNNITAKGGNNTLYGGASDDVMIGAGGNDFLVGGKGVNALEGGKGADRFDIRQGENTLLFNWGDSTAASMDVVTFAADAGDNTAVQKFMISAMPSGIFHANNIAAPETDSINDLIAALNAGYQAQARNEYRAAVVVQFDNKDTYLVVDNDSASIDRDDVVIKLVGQVPEMSLDGITINFGATAIP